MSEFPCLTLHVWISLSHPTCLNFPVSLCMSEFSCLTLHVWIFLSHPACLNFPVSPCMSEFFCLTLHVWIFLSHPACLNFPVSTCMSELLMMRLLFGLWPSLYTVKFEIIVFYFLNTNLKVCWFIFHDVVFPFDPRHSTLHWPEGNLKYDWEAIIMVKKQVVKISWGETPSCVFETFIRFKNGFSDKF